MNELRTGELVPFPRPWARPTLSASRPIGMLASIYDSEVYHRRQLERIVPLMVDVRSLSQEIYCLLELECLPPHEWLWDYCHLVRWGSLGPALWGLKSVADRDFGYRLMFGHQHTTEVSYEDRLWLRNGNLLARASRTTLRLPSLG